MSVGAFAYLTSWEAIHTGSYIGEDELSRFVCLQSLSHISGKDGAARDKNERGGIMRVIIKFDNV
mgnify:CR=1 FL=1